MAVSLAGFASSRELEIDDDETSLDELASVGFDAGGGATAPVAGLSAALFDAVFISEQAPIVVEDLLNIGVFAACQSMRDEHA